MLSSCLSKMVILGVFALGIGEAAFAHNSRQAESLAGLSVEYLFNRWIPYTRYPAPASGYNVETELPSLKEALLVHIGSNGHIMIWYKGRIIDARGLAMVKVTNTIKKQASLPKGAIFAIHKLPEDFDIRFSDYERTFEPSKAKTCAKSACSTLRQLNVFGLDKSVRPNALGASTFFKYFLTLSDKQRQAIGLEIVAIGTTPAEIYETIKTGELSIACEDILIGARNLIGSIIGR